MEALGTTLDFRGFYENIESFKLYNIDQLAYLKAEAHEVSLQFKLLFSGKISISPMSVVFEDSSNGTTIENLPAKHDGLFSAEAETNSGKSIVSCLIHHNSDRWLKNSNQIEIRPLKDNRKKIFVNLKIEVCVLPIVSDKPENEYIAWIRMGSQTDDGQKESRKSTKSNVLFYDAENGTQIADKSSSKNSEESNIIIQHKYVIGVTTSPRVVYEDKTIVISSAIDWLQYRENENTISLNEGEYEPTPNRNLTKIDLHLTIERKDLQ